MPVLYRVETYIVPEVNKFPAPATPNEFDDIKIANRPRFIDESVSEGRDNARHENDDGASCVRLYDHPACLAVDSSSGCKSVNAQILVDLNERKAVYDKRLDEDHVGRRDEEGNFRRSDDCADAREAKFRASIRPQDAMYPARQFRRINSLMSIDETSEGSEACRLNDLCHHGYRNGCTATIPSPEEVSEEVFKENWLQKIEMLRQREAAVTAREMILQDRERQLFKREKEVRIAERMVREKLRLLEQQQRDTWSVDRKLEEVERVLSGPDVFKESRESRTKESKASTEEPRNVPTGGASSSVIPSDGRIKEPDRRPTRNPTMLHARSSSLRSSRQSVGFRSYSNTRYKERPKVSCDDMDSTLSADVGDSSFVRTSERFNPEAYKKPYAFTRSASERRSNAARTAQGVVALDERPEHVVEEDKVLRRISENIFATQDKETKFQHYGLVDLQPDDKTERTSSSKEGRVAHLDLATGNRHGQRKPAVAGAVKDRPISWNEETNEWLQRKRQAYNLATKKSAENKENLRCNTVAQKDDKTSKKNVKSKIFTIFR